MAKEPMLSVIVPVYNAENTLDQCLKSVAKQSYSDFEVILIDDGSKDRSGEICDNWSVLEERFRTIHISNHGVSYARNLGLSNVLGKYVMFVDSDDRIHEDYFLTYMTQIEADHGDVVIGGLIRKEDKQVRVQPVPCLGKRGREIWEEICLSPEMFGYIAGKIFRMDIILENQIRFNEKMYAQEDLDFNLSVYDKCNTFEMIDYTGYEYQYTPGKRKPPVWDFLANSLKMQGIACEKTELSFEAQNAIKSRIVAQIFSFLYQCNDKEEYTNAVARLCGVTGLNQYLKKQKLSGEAAIVISRYLAGKYDWVYEYFQLRKKVKKILKRPVSE